MISTLWRYVLGRLTVGLVWIGETTRDSRSARLVTMGLELPEPRDSGNEGWHMEQRGGWR